MDMIELLKNTQPMDPSTTELNKLFDDYEFKKHILDTKLKIP